MLLGLSFHQQESKIVNLIYAETGDRAEERYKVQRLNDGFYFRMGKREELVGLAVHTEDLPLLFGFLLPGPSVSNHGHGLRKTDLLTALLPTTPNNLKSQ